MPSFTEANQVQLDGHCYETKIPRMQSVKHASFTSRHGRIQHVIPLKRRGLFTAFEKARNRTTQDKRKRKQLLTAKQILSLPHGTMNMPIPYAAVHANPT